MAEWSCPDHRGERNYVGVDARNLRNGTCDVLVVGEAPGPQEYKVGYPFIGPSGELLREFLRRAGLDRRCIYTNVVKHWPHQGRKTLTPTSAEVDTCSPHLLDEIEKFQPRIIVAVGETAGRFFGGKGTIGAMQGKVFHWQDVPVVAIYHPSYLLRVQRAPEAYRRAERSIKWALAEVAWQLEHGSDPLPSYVESDYYASSSVPLLKEGWAYDTETTGKDLDSDLLLLSGSDGDGCYVTRPTEIYTENGTIWHNALFDLPILMHHGMSCPEWVEDTMVMAWLLGEDRLGLKALAKKYLGTPVMTYDEMLATEGWHPKMEYSAQDSVLTRRLFDFLQTRLERPQDRDWYQTIARPLLPILSRASVRGFQVDREGLKVLLHGVWQRRAALQVAIESHAWKGINVNSWQQVGKLLFDELHLPVVKKTKTGGRSTDDDVLVALSARHPVVSLILAWRGADKLISTYIRSLLEAPTAHTLYQMTGTETGRLSSSLRNLQNIPKKIKGYFTARPGYTFVMADYDQVELRVAAALAGDEAMLSDIRNGVDLHAKLACAVWPEWTPATLPKQLRARAKNANFERLYGGGDRRMAETLDVGLEKAKVFARLFPGVESWADSTAAEAVRTGWIATAFGRRRRLFDAYSTSDYLRGKAGRQAINTPIQGTVADMVHLATLKVTPWLQQLGGDFQHQEHDCIMAEVPLDRAEESKQALIEAMTSVIPDIISERVTITATPTVSERWV